MTTYAACCRISCVRSLLQAGVESTLELWTPSLRCYVGPIYSPLFTRQLVAVIKSIEGKRARTKIKHKKTQEHGTMSTQNATN